MNMRNYSRGFASIALLGLLAIGTVAAIVAQRQHLVELNAQLETLDERFGAFRPSGYTGKLLTRLTEGGAESSFNTTPCTTPDGQTITTNAIGDFIVITVNPGAANEEKISATAASCTGTTLTWSIANRGLSFASPTTTITANKEAHAIGETVIISDDDHFTYAQYPAKDQAETITGLWSVSTPTSGSHIANKDYVDGRAFGGIGNASETATGTVEIATVGEIAAGTTNGSLGRLAIPASAATSTWTASATTGNVPALSSDGKLDNNFISTSTLLDATSTIMIGDFPAWHIGKQAAFYDTAGTTTFAVPPGITKVFVTTCSAGAGAGGATNNTAGAGAGAGGGGCAYEWVDVTGTTSIQVHVGAPGAGDAGSGTGTAGSWSTFGTNGFYNYATGGLPGATEGGVGGIGGCGVGGTINTCGGNGDGSFSDDSEVIVQGGRGGGCDFGGGTGSRTSDGDGIDATGYCSGGAGAVATTATDRAGGDGSKGFVAVQW